MVERTRVPLALAVALVLAPSSPRAATPTARLEVGWISRDPFLPPPSRPGAPREEGWPEVGSRVDWVAHLLNRGTATAAAVPYVWRVDGEQAAAGVVDVPPGQTVVTFPWDWTFDRHLVTFEMLPPPQLADASRDDDALTVASDALALGIWIQQGVYDWMATGDRPGFERWIQREVGRWNRILERAVYPTTPRGALDRIRLENVVVLPDGQGPRNHELTHDLYWFFRSSSGDPRFLAAYAPPETLADSTIVLHELLHQRGLTDLYAYDVLHGFGETQDGSSRSDSRVLIAEAGRPIVGTSLMPAIVRGPEGLLVYRAQINGLMGTLYRASANLTEHCANGLNRNAGRRTPVWFDQWGNRLGGFANAGDRDNYVNLLPRVTDVRLVDETGASVRGAAVDVYMDHSPWTYTKVYTATPDRTYASDALGVVSLPGDLLDGLPPAAAPPKSQVMVLGVRTDRARGYAFVPLHDLNLAYFRQGPDRGDLTVQVRLHPW
jgi:hypothetical protein